VYFDGIDDYARFSQNLTTILGSDYSGPLTIAFWFNSQKPSFGSSYQDNEYIYRGDGSSESTFTVRYTNISDNGPITQPHLTVHVRGGGPKGYSYSIPHYLEPNVGWRHVVITLSSFARNTSNTIQYYINGIRYATLSITNGNTTDMSSAGYLGVNGSFYYFTGFIDELYIYKRVLTDKEIMTLFTRTY